MKLIFFTVLFTCISFGKIYSQSNKIWNDGMIENQESDLVKKYNLFAKKPKNKNKKENFVEAFNESITNHNNYLLKIEKVDDNSTNKDWIGLINNYNSLRYIYDLSNPMLSSCEIPYKDYNSQLESIKTKAVDYMYSKAENYFNTATKSENNRDFSVAYRNFMAVNELKPNYKSTQSYLDQLTSIVNSNEVYIAPVTFGNSGNYFSISLSKNGDAFNIVNDLKNNLSQNSIGFKIVDNKSLLTKFLIDLDWKTINVDTTPANNVTYSRTAKRDNKDLNATVVYKKYSIHINSIFNLIIMDVNKNVDILNKDITSSDTHWIETATYTGDYGALNAGDIAAVNRGNFFNQSQFVSDALKSLYQNKISVNIFNEINNTIGW